MPAWLDVREGAVPLIVSIPHAGTEIPAEIESRLVSPWRARKDADWHLEKLYGFAAELGATTVHTRLSRSVIDVNRDPSGAPLYPGRATTGLCPLTTFDGEPLYMAGAEPDEDEIDARRRAWFDPYHAALAGQVARLRAGHARVVVYEAHSIRSAIPRMFEGELPHFSIGTNGGKSCDVALTRLVDAACRHPAFRRVVDGRFQGGWTTRDYGRPETGVHALQMELACRGYMREPNPVAPGNWPTDYDPASAASLAGVLRDVLTACIRFAEVPA